MKHGAPVVSLVVVDHDMYPLPDPIQVQNERAKPPNMTGHSVIICTEEQFKVSSLRYSRALGHCTLTRNFCDISLNSVFSAQSCEKINVTINLLQRKKETIKSHHSFNSSYFRVKRFAE